MNTIDLENLKCCFCEKVYVNNASFEKHKLLCQIINDKYDEEKKIDTKNLTQLVCYLIKNNIKLENDLNELKKWIQIKKKKFAVLDWLNESYFPSQDIDKWKTSLVVTREHLNYLFKNNYTDGVLNIIKDYLPLSKENYLPLKSFDQKDNTIFMYQKNNWIVLEHVEFEKLVQYISKKIITEFKNWQDENEDKLYNDDFSVIYIENVRKIMGGKHTVEQQNNIIHKNLYKHLKLNLKNIIQYEFSY
jgi:hypothetical protein